MDARTRDPPARSVLDAAAEALLVQLRANPLIRSKVLRYLTERDQYQIARRMTEPVLAAAFNQVAEEFQPPERIRTRRGRRQIVRLAYKDHELRWCGHCGGARWSKYADTALRCLECGNPTKLLPAEDVDDDREVPPQPPQAPDRLADRLAGTQDRLGGSRSGRL